MSPFRQAPLLRPAACLAVGICVADALFRHAVPVSPSVYPLLAVGCLLLTVLGEGFLRVRMRHRPALQGSPLVLFRFPLYASILLLIAIASVGAWRYEAVSRRVVMPWPAGRVDCRAVVRSHAEPRARSVRYLLDVEGRRVYGYLYGADSPLTCGWGDTLVLHDVVIEPPHSFSDSLSFDYARYLYSRRISGTVLVPSQHVVCHPYSGTPPLYIRWRQQAVGRLQALYARAGLPDDVLGVVEALSLGDKRLLDDGVRDAYSDAGASHMLALSGLHVGFLYFLLLLPLQLVFRSRTGRRLCHVLAAVLLWLFAILTGLPPSLVRAVTMFSLYALASFLGGDRSPLNTLALTALVMLGIQPFLLFDVAFQLSFSSMLGILVVMPMWNKPFLGVGDGLSRLHLLKKALRRMADAAVRVMQVSVAAQLGTCPLVLYHFGTFPVYFLVTNLVVLPVLYAVLVLLVVWILLLPTSLAPMAAALLTSSVRLLNTLPASISHWPCSTLHVPGFTFPDAVLLWTVFLFLLRYQARKHTPSAVLALACIAALLAFRLFGI